MRIDKITANPVAQHPDNPNSPFQPCRLALQGSCLNPGQEERKKIKNMTKSGEEGGYLFFGIVIPLRTAAGRCKFVWSRKGTEYQKNRKSNLQGESGKLRWETSISVLLP